MTPPRSACAAGFDVDDAGGSRGLEINARMRDSNNAAPESIRAACWSIRDALIAVYGGRDDARRTGSGNVQSSLVTLPL